MTFVDAGPDADRVRELLGRDPQGRYEVVVRDAAGDPVVLRNAPLLDDGTPMPTRYWLIGPDEIRRIGQLEAAGGVNAAEAAIPADELAAAHARYAAERDAEIPADHTGPRPFGGVGGTRIGVKCLHAHWGWHLAGGDDPVGRWIAARLGVDATTIAPGAAHLDLGDDSFTVRLAATPPLDQPTEYTVPWGPVSLTQRWLLDDDPPRPEALTNALGTVDDHLDDVQREHSSFAFVHRVTLGGPHITALARLEVGSDSVDDVVQLTRAAAEEIFRLVATERRDERAANPGLPSTHVESILATCVIVSAVMRRLDLPSVALDARATATN